MADLVTKEDALDIHCSILNDVIRISLHSSPKLGLSLHLSHGSFPPIPLQGSLTLITVAWCAFLNKGTGF